MSTTVGGFCQKHRVQFLTDCGACAHERNIAAATPAMLAALHERIAKLEAMAHPPVDVTALTLQIAESCARCWEADPHQFSARPCSTCSTLSALLGRAFGCTTKAVSRG